MIGACIANVIKQYMRLPPPLWPKASTYPPLELPQSLASTFSIIFTHISEALSEVGPVGQVRRTKQPVRNQLNAKVSTCLVAVSFGHSLFNQKSYSAIGYFWFNGYLSIWVHGVFKFLRVQKSESGSGFSGFTLYCCEITEIMGLPNCMLHTNNELCSFIWFKNSE